MSEREKLLNMLRAYSFAAYEWNLYLDTHPNDKQGIAMHRKMADRAEELTKEYQRKYGPLTASAVTDQNCWDWIEEPWPWD